MPADPGILKRIRRCPFARGGRVTVRFRANGYSLYSRRSNLPLARLRLTGAADEVVVLYPSHRGGWQPAGDFGTIALPLDQALKTISTNPLFSETACAEVTEHVLWAAAPLTVSCPKWCVRQMG